MKKTMKFLSMTALALVGAVMTVGCSSDDDINDATQQPEAVKGNTITLTTTVSLDNSDATTRALAGTGEKTFAKGETMALVYQNKNGETVKVESAELKDGDIESGSKSATFTFQLTDPKKEGNVTYIYPAAMANDDGTVNYAALNSQDGTLSKLSSDLDLATSTAAWDGNNLPQATLDNQLAILAITLKDADGSDLTATTTTTTKLTLSDGTNTYNVDRSAAAGPIYVAIQPTNSADIDITATCGENGFYKSLSDKTYAAGNGYEVGWKRETNVQLSKLKGDYIAQTGDVLTGTLAGDYAISIASGASVTLNGVTINRGNSSSRKLPGIQCKGKATITLVGDNTVNASFNGDSSTEDYAGIQVGPSGTTLTIQGEGSLSATGQYDSAGIGGSSAGGSAGNINIVSGTINATGGYDGAGIGSAWNKEFGTITISGGNVTAVGHGNAAGIGTGYLGTCDDITISGGTVTATGAEWAAGIGSGGDVSECGDILISGGTVTATGGSDAAGIGGGYAGEYCTNTCGNITITSGVTHVTATKGGSNEDDSTEPVSIGAGGHLNSYSVWDEDLEEEVEVEGGESKCGTVTIQSGANVTQN